MLYQYRPMLFLTCRKYLFALSPCVKPTWITKSAIRVFSILTSFICWADMMHRESRLIANVSCCQPVEKRNSPLPLVSRSWDSTKIHAVHTRVREFKSMASNSLILSYDKLTWSKLRGRQAEDHVMVILVWPNEHGNSRTRYIYI